MAQKKLLRFAEIKKFGNVLEYPEGMKGSWRSFFKNENPVILELACGRGEYTIGLAQLYPGKNFVGVDVKGNRLYIGAKRGLDAGLFNAAFLRTQIEMLPDYFEDGEVDEIWITFPDPQLRTSKAKKRLTHPRFLRLYQKILKLSGPIHLKTDSPDLHDFTGLVIDLYKLELLEESGDIYASEAVDKALQIKTHYEMLDIAQSRKIHYIKFRLHDNIRWDDEALQKILKTREDK